MAQLCTMPPDAYTPGARFWNVSAAVSDDGRIHLSGHYTCAGLIPALVFSVGAPWAASQCVRNVCCLWDLANTMRDAELVRALGSPHCDERVDLSGVNLMKEGNAPGSGRWDVRTSIQPSFVAMLFICLQPFYVWYEVVPLRWQSMSVPWSATWYGQPCRNVPYGDGSTVCIHCANEKPERSEYVFTPNWFRSFRCDWVCHEGYVGSGCEVSTSAAAAAAIGVVGVSLVGALVFVLRRAASHHHQEGMKAGAAEILTLQTPASMMKGGTIKVDHNLIVFRDNLPVSEIRIKLN